MIWFCSVTTLIAWLALAAIGETVARLLFGRRSALVGTSIRVPLGLAASVCILEGAGFFLPIRRAAWLLLPPALYGAARGLRNVWRTRRVECGLLGASCVALLVGLVPVFIAGRFTAAALTNNDGTYYITTADRLLSTPWRITYEVRDYVIPIDQCLVERVLHWWNWRTGTPNLMAALMAFFGLSSPETLAIVTALLFACVPPAGIGVARGLGVEARGTRGFLVGLIAVCSAAPAFVGYQHMTGQLAACSLFPLAMASLLGVARHGGLARHVVAALVLGAGVALFADGAAVLVLLALAVPIASVHRRSKTTGRMLLAGVATITIAPFTIMRAFRAATGTAGRVSKPQRVLFPQRGWLPRHALDDLATLMGVDPWPPWPAAWPPNAQTVVTWVAALSGLALFGFGFARLRSRTGERGAALVVCGAVLLTLGLLHVQYLVGKVLLMAAAFTVPLCAVGVATMASWRTRWIAAPFIAGEVLGLTQLADPSRWKVVDRPEHDALVAQLARLPPGSLIAFDGLGAPADFVLDAHRAYRAALLAHLLPIDPGLDGGFYKPRCETATRPKPLPPRAHALQRVSSEILTRGRQVAAWNDFRLLETDLQHRESFVATWAPTHGWLPAEREPTGRVFRWAESQAKGTLQVVGPAPCARLKGQLRVVEGTASVEVKAENRQLYADVVSSDWTTLMTRPFPTASPMLVLFSVDRASAVPPDAAHALAVSNLALENSWDCGASFHRDDDAQPLVFPIDFEGDLDLRMDPLAFGPCADVSISIQGRMGAMIGLRVDGGPPVLHYVSSRSEEVVTRSVDTTQPRRLKLTHTGGSGTEPWKMTNVTVTPRPCAW